MRNLKAVIVFLLVFVIAAQVSRAQVQPDRTLKEVLNTISNYNTAFNPEKIFVQLDKPAYNREDTLWFKSYVLDAASLGASTKSGVMYIEIDDENNQAITRNMVSLVAGTGWGNIPLTEKEFPEGNYILRAYTNWARNFDEHYVYTRAFTINSVRNENWLISSRFNITQPNGVTNIDANITFVRADKHPLIAEQLRTKITAGRSTLYRTNVMTGVDGSTDFSFNLTDKTDPHRVTINLAKKGKGADDVTFAVPVIINRDEKTDLQFMPEGGNLIAGIRNRVAFKAINEEGKGTDVSGELYNSKQQQVTSFKSAHLGMGVFNFTPDAGETYTAHIKLNGKQLSYNLPAVKSSGVFIHVDNTTTADSVAVTIVPTTDLREHNDIYYLAVQTRGVICYGALINTRLVTGRFTMAKSLFPSGIARFTLLNASYQPVAERITFIDQHDAISLSVTPTKTGYDKRDSVSLAITATDKNDRPVMGSFALTVTDDAQVKPDSTGADNILANLLLTDDLKGNVENPGWYFTNGDTDAKAAALDNLLLTQGWVSYNWGDVFQPLKTPTYTPEQRFAVKGRVTNIFNKPVPQSQIVLLSTKPPIVVDTLTNANGEFMFTNLHPADTVAYTIQAKNKRGKAFGIGVDVDEFKPPVFNSSMPRFVPWYVNIDTGRLNSIHARQSYNLEQDKLLGVHALKEVQIKDKKVVKDSKNLLGPGESDFALNDRDLNAMGKVTLGDVLLKKVKGFTDNVRGRFYGINGTFTVFVFDGVLSLKFIPPGTSYSQYMRDLLGFIMAEDVKGIEVMTGGAGQLRYFSEFMDPRDDPFKYNFIEITTYSGNGLFMKKTPGTYLYRPPVFASQKQFYSPKYTVKKTDLFMDTRSTLFWEPNVITDNTGCATVSFYTGDKSGTYNIRLQGADLTGGLGSTQSRLTVKTSTP